MPKGKQAAFKMTGPAAEVGTEDAPCFGEVPESSCEDVSEDVMAFWRICSKTGQEKLIRLVLQRTEK